MGHSIDLSKYNMRTDLAIDVLDNNKIDTEITKDKYKNISIIRTKLNKESASLIGKMEGNYVTIEFDDVTDIENRCDVKEIFTNELIQILNENNIKENSKILVVGLGNVDSTPDSLGPKVIDNILVTRHLFLIDDVEDGYREVSAIKPGVTGETGIETSDLIKSIINTIKPDLVIAVDALASQSMNRINKTIQITDTGIQPGSGVGNSRKELSLQTIGVPVLAIGVPTVVDAATIVNDTISYMQKYYAFHKNYSKKPIHKMTLLSKVNYLKDDVVVTKNDKEKLLGIIGSFTEDEMKQLFFEVLSPIGYNFMVTTKEIDFVIENLSYVISSGINEALHKKIKSN